MNLHSNSMIRGQKKKIHSIQFLRCAASFAVVISHSFNVVGIVKKIYITGPSVDVFFIISGIVMGYTISDGDSPLQFAMRRLARVIPMYWIALTSFIIFKLYCSTDTFTTIEIIRSYFLFPAGPVPILFPTWTLTYEMFFYSIIVVVLSTSPKNVVGISIMAMIFFSSFSLPVLSEWNGGDPLFNFGDSEYLEFGVGLIIALYLKSHELRYPRLGLLAVVLGTIALAINNQMPDVRVLSWGIPGALLVFGTLQFEESSFFKIKLIRLCGRASYCVYLFHIPIMSYIFFQFTTNGSIRHRDLYFIMPLLIMCGWSGGLILHVAIESPLLKAILPRFGTGARTPTGKATITRAA